MKKTHSVFAQGAKVRGYLIYLSLLVSLLFSTAWADVERINDPLHKKIKQILLEFGADLNVGILVQNLNTGKVIYKKNADRYFMPASIQKLFTAFAALNYLGPNFIYQTQLFADLAKIRNGVLDDDVYLKFSGDPTLTFSQLENLISTLKQAGIQKINGHFIIDDTAFDQVTMSPGTTWDDREFCFGSPISALLLDHNCVVATLTPAANPDQPAILSLPRQPQFMQFVNRVVTRGPITAECKIEAKFTDEKTFTLQGCIKSTDEEKNIMLAVDNPHRYIQNALVYLLNKNQISIQQGIAFQKIEIPLKLLASESSQPLTTLINTMLKDSDNTIANSIFKTIGSFYFQEAGSWQNGHRALHDILLKAIQLDIPNTTLVDGAGASRYNFITPKQVVKLLRQVYLSPYAAVFISSLPISGVDGTLKNRMKEEITRGKVRAKTGTETAVTALSGYLETRSKQILVFAILINGFVDAPPKYAQIEDKICNALVEGA